MRERQPVSYTFRAIPVKLMNYMPRFSSALKSPERDAWLDGIIDKFNTIIEARTWEPYDQPRSNDTFLPSGIVFKLRRDQNGRPARYKARLVCRGNLQEDGDSYADLYTPVA